MTLTADQFKALKTKVNNEMTRRNGYGPLNSYATAFTVSPDQNTSILAEHGKGTIDNALRITDINGLKLVEQGDYIPDNLDFLSTFIDSITGESMEGNSSTCRGACTGLCIDSCATTCSGTCGVNSCQKTCGTVCGSCSNSCVTSCGASCSATCGSACTGYCYAACKTGCSDGCKGCTGSSA